MLMRPVKRRDQGQVVNAVILLAMLLFWAVTLGTLAVFPKDSLPVMVDKYFLNQMLPWLMVGGLVWLANRPRI